MNAAADPACDLPHRPPPWRATVLTLFPAMFPGFLGCSLAGKALEKGLWALETVDIRAFARDKHRSVDDTPFGGGPGMVMRADILDAALNHARQAEEQVGHPPSRVIYLCPRGVPMNQGHVRQWAQEPGLTLLCGRYEGIDERVLDAHRIELVSLGDFVLSGGEPAALCLLDAVIRLLPGVMGNVETAGEESFERGLLEYPHYTRPPIWEGRSVPQILLSGNHAEIRAWRLAEAERLTEAHRPDLWLHYLADRPAPKVKKSRVRKNSDPALVGIRPTASTQAADPTITEDERA
jgi:tRNA (guanine37-N1)-methyltransferase